MKKFISIILAVIIAFSTITVGVSAYKMDNEGVWIGCDGDVAYTDPGVTKDLPISIAANIADKLAEKEIDIASAVMTIPFSVETDENSPITKVELTDAAKAAGAKYEQKSATATLVDGTITVPYASLDGNNSMVVVNVTVKMSEDWKVVDYKAEKPVLVKVSEKYGTTGVTVADKNEVKAYVSLMMTDFSIKATPYKPNFIEKAIEWIKQKLLMIPVLFQTLNSYLLSDPLSEPKWVKGVKEREEFDRKELEEMQQADQ